MIDLHASWQRMWTGIGASGDGASVYGDLVKRYAEPHRRYHTAQHLGDCLNWFEAVMDQAPHPHEVEAALWFHDAVYQPSRHDNEECSAALARTALLQAGVPAAAAGRVEHLVLATRHSAPADSADEQLLLDIDLAILGAPASRFVQYQQQIRQEYSFVPEPLFAARRQAILSAFLRRSQIYSTAQFRSTLEQQARSNLSGALDAMARQARGPQEIAERFPGVPAAE